MESNTILDALGDAAIRTVAKYEEHIDNGRFLEAAQCLATVETITFQAQQIERNDDQTRLAFPAVTREANS